MAETWRFPGIVYILENTEAQRVKVGMTNSNVEGRLTDVKRKWLGLSGTCQICGGRRLVKRIKLKRIIPKHVISGAPCSGSDFPPLECDTALASRYLETLKLKQGELKGIELGSNTKMINTLEDRIERYEKFEKPLKGSWEISTIYRTIRAEEVEKKVHELLAVYLDKNVPFGEVFKCTVEEAHLAIDTVLEREGLLDSTSKSVLL